MPGFSYRDAIVLGMSIDSKGYTSGGRSIIDTTSRMGKAFIFAQTNQDQLTEKMLKSKKVISETAMIQQKASSEMLRYASAATSAGAASYFLFKNMRDAVKEAAAVQKTLVDVNIAMGNIGEDFSSKQSVELIKSIKGVQSHIYGLNDAAKSYFIVSSAGMQGMSRWGKDITQLGVQYAKLYHSLSRGKVSLEDASNFIPELLAKTGASMEIQFNNGETQLERYLDMMGKAEVLTKIKMENMRDILDSTGASWRNFGVSFAAGLSVVGMQMNAGQSARNAGQSAKSLFDKFQTDIAVLGSQKMLYDTDGDMLNKLDRLNTQVIKHQQDIAKAYGGTQQFQAIINGVLSGKIDAAVESKKLESMFKSGVLSAKGFNALHAYYKGLSSLNDDSIKGTKQQKRLLLGLGMLYGDGKPNSQASVEAGRKRYEEMITEVKLGNMSVNDMLKELGDKLEAIRKDGKKGVYNYMLASKLIFSDTTSHTAFLNMMQAKAKVSQDVYLTDSRTGERVRSINELSYKDQVKYKELLSKKLIDETVKGIRLYKVGQYVTGADVALYTEKAAQDSAHFAATTFEATMKTIEARVKIVKTNLGVIRDNIGEGFLAPVSASTDVILGFTDSLRLLTSSSKSLSDLFGSMAGSAASVLAVMAAVMGVKAFGKLSAGVSSSLGLPTKAGSIKAKEDINSLDLELSKIKEERDNLIKRSHNITKGYEHIESSVNKRLKLEDESLIQKINNTKFEQSIDKQTIKDKIKKSMDSQNTKLKSYLKGSGLKYSDLYGDVDALARIKFGDIETNKRLRALNSKKLEVLGLEFNTLLDKQKSERLNLKTSMKESKISSDLRVEKLKELRRLHKIQQESLTSGYGISVSDAMYYRGREGKILDRVAKDVSKADIKQWKSDIIAKRANYSRLRNLENSQIQKLKDDLRLTDASNKEKLATLRSEVKARKDNLRNIKLNYLKNLGVTQKDISAYKSGSAFRGYDKNIDDLNNKRENLQSYYNVNYGGDYTGFFSELKTLNKETAGTAKGFKSLQMRMNNFGKVFSSRGGLGGMFNRGYMNMMGSPFAMMGTMGALGLMSWGLSQMKANDSFGINNILGDRAEGRVGLVQASLNRYSAIDKFRAGGKVTWDELLGMLNKKDEYLKYRDLIMSTRNTRQSLVGGINGEGNAALQIVAEKAASQGQYTEGYWNSLFGNDSEKILRKFQFFTGVTSKYLDIDTETGKYKISDDELIQKAIDAGLNENTIKLLKEGGTGAFRGGLDRVIADPGSYNKWLQGTTDIENKIAELTGLKKDPWGYNLWKWFQGVGSKYLGSIAMGVGAGSLGLGLLFGKSYLGGMIGLLASQLIYTLSDPNSDNRQKAIKLAATTIGGIIGGVVGGPGGALLGANLTLGGVNFTEGAIRNEKEKRAAYSDYLRDKGYDAVAHNTYLVDNSLLNMGMSHKWSEKEGIQGQVWWNDFNKRWEYNSAKFIPEKDKKGNYVVKNGKVQGSIKKFSIEVDPAEYGASQLAYAQQKNKYISYAIDENGNYVLDLYKRSDYDESKLKAISGAMTPFEAEIKRLNDEYNNFSLNKDGKPGLGEDNTSIPDIGFNEKLSKPFDDNTDATRDAAYATEQLTKQLKETEDVWFFDMNKGLYDSSIYNPRDKHIRNDFSDNALAGFKLDLSEDARKLLKFDPSLPPLPEGKPLFSNEFGMQQMWGRSQ